MTIRQVLMPSVVTTRRKDIGMQSECVNDNPDMEFITLSLSKLFPAAAQLDLPSYSGKVPLLVPGEKNSTGINQTAET